MAVHLKRWFLCLCLLSTSGFSFAGSLDYGYRVVATYPHSPDVFTQGLVYYNHLLYESGGQYGQSQLLTRTLGDATPLQQQFLSPQLFAEGITILNGKVYQLTWKSGLGFIYDAKTLEQVDEFKIEGEGWGITDDDSHLIISNGSSELDFIDPKTSKVVKTIYVRYQGQPVERLNELEWIDGQIYANIWGSNWVVIIDPENGNIRGRIQLSNLLSPELRTRQTDVLNGIAYDDKQKRLFVTGKYWPRLYQIELIPPK